MMPTRGTEPSAVRIAPPFLRITAPPIRIAAAPQPAAITTRDGRLVTGGTIEISGTANDWSATLRCLDRPGVVASAYFVGGVRDVVLVLQDGRRARARITSTSFIAASERVCVLTGVDPLT